MNESSLSRLYDYIRSSDVAFVTAFKSLINGRPFVMGENLIEPNIKSELQRKRFENAGN